MPKVSVIIPVYNVELYLRECLDSVINQTYKDLEIICVDDGSTDESLSILKEYEAKDTRVKVIVASHANAGAARNIGYEASNGEYLSFLDADDVFAPPMIETLYNALKSAGAEVAYCDMRNFDSESQLPELAKTYSDNFKIIDNADKTFNVFKEFYGWTWDKLFARSLIEKYKLRFQEQPAHNDMLFSYEACCLASRIVKTDAVLIAHRKHAGSISRNRDKNPLCFSLALRTLHGQLQSLGFWERHPAALRYFHNYILALGFWTLDVLGQRDTIDLAYGEFRKLLSEQGALDKNAEYMDVYPHLFKRYLSLCRNEDALLYMREVALQARNSARPDQKKPRPVEAKTKVEVKKPELVKGTRTMRNAPLRVLFAVRGGTNAITANTFVATLAGALRAAGAEVACGIDLFWDAVPDSYDIVHLQWPEALIGWKSENATDELLARLLNRLSELKAAGTKIVYTRHNRKPHKISGENINKLTEIFETNADVIIHMGETSRRECLEAYPNSAVRHVVIPHHLKDEIDFSISREEARAKLGISADAKVMLSFGAFRHEEEVALVKAAVNGLDIQNFKLLAPLCPGDTYKGLVPDAELPAYFAAADIVFLQRVRVLNSGVLPLAYDAARVCVGPSDGNAGEILANTDNPTFDPCDHASVVAAIKRGFALSAEGKGEANRTYARLRWSPKQVAEQHLALYHDLSGIKAATGGIKNAPHCILSEAAWLEIVNGKPIMRNWGDDLNWHLLKRLTDVPIQPIASVKTIMPDDMRLLFIGSGADSRLYDEHSVVWGTGSLRKESVIKTRPRKVCAVRGPLTRKKFLSAGIDCPEVYGDPALLLPIIYQPKVEKKYKLGVAVHFREWYLPCVTKFRQDHPEILFIDMGDYVSWTDIPDKICSCEAIVSSSLHALIVADAYQVPNAMIKFSDLVKGGTWKFKDYYAGVGRKFFEPLDFKKKVDLAAVDTLLKKYQPINFDPNKLLSVSPIPLNIRPVVSYDDCSRQTVEYNVEGQVDADLDYYLDHSPRENIDEFKRGMEQWLKKDQDTIPQANVSVVIPVYNAEKHIDKCLESILNQNLSLEIICVDDCSTDKSFELCQAWADKDSRVKAFRMPRNSPAGRCRNYGAALATGEYLMFMEAEDELESGSLAEYYNLAKADNLDVLRGTARAFDDATGEIIERSYYQQEEIKGKVVEQAVSLRDDIEVAEMSPEPWIGIASTSFIKRNKLAFDALQCSNDVSFFYGLISKAKRIRFLRRDIVRHRVNNKLSLTGDRAENYQCVIESTRIVYQKTSTLPTALRAKIMMSILSAYPRWIREAKAYAADELSVAQNFRAHLRELDFNFLGGEIERTSWYCQLVDILGEDPLGVEAKFSRSYLLRRARSAENLEMKRVIKLAETTAKLTEVSRSLEELKVRDNKRITKLKSLVAEQKKQVSALKKKTRELASSASYRVGLLITWPARKLWRAFRNNPKAAARHKRRGK